MNLPKPQFTAGLTAAEIAEHMGWELRDPPNITDQDSLRVRIQQLVSKAEAAAFDEGWIAGREQCAAELEPYLRGMARAMGRSLVTIIPIHDVEQSGQ